MPCQRCPRTNENASTAIRDKIIPQLCERLRLLISRQPNVDNHLSPAYSCRHLQQSLFTAAMVTDIGGNVVVRVAPVSIHAGRAIYGHA
jgi:hypothetical protein